MGGWKLTDKYGPFCRFTNSSFYRTTSDEMRQRMANGFTHDDYDNARAVLEWRESRERAAEEQQKQQQQEEV